MVTGQGLPVQLICHTKPYKNRNFHIQVVLHDTLVYDSENWSTYQQFAVVSLFLFLGPSLIGAVMLVINSYSRYCNKETESGTFTIVLYDLGLEAEIVSWDTMDFNFNKGINHLEDNGSCKIDR